MSIFLIWILFFDFKKPGDHWALDNHDTRNENIEWFEEYMGKPRYCAYSENTIATIVMDGNIIPLDCESLNEQFNSIKMSAIPPRQVILYF